MKPKDKHTLGVSLRLAVDAVIVTMAFMVAFSIRFVIVVLWTHEVHPHALPSLVDDYLRTFLVMALPMVAAVVGVMGAFGLYSPSRRPAKATDRLLRMAQAISLAFMVFGFLVFYFGPGYLFPRAVLALAWFFSLAGLVLSRLGATALEGVRATEGRRRRMDDRAVARHVLVIGGAGYIGPPLIARLLAEGCKVRVLDLLLYGSEPIAQMMDHPGFELVKGDFRNIEVVIRAMQNIDAVVHLGGLVGDPACALDEELTLEINVAATRMIAETARGLGVRRFVFASSCSVYGASEHLLTEESELNPVSLYARSKIEGEKVLLEMKSDEFSPILLRFSTIYGLAPRPRFDLVVNLFAAKACTDGEIQVFGGDQWRPFVHVTDVGEAIRLCLFSRLDLTAGRVFNVGSEAQNYTIAQIAELVHKALPNTRVVMNGADVDQRDYRVSFDRIKNELGFRPRVTVEDGILEIIDALTSGRIRDYRDPRYSNVLSLKEEGALQSARSTRITQLYRAVAAPTSHLATSSPTEGVGSELPITTPAPLHVADRARSSHARPAIHRPTPDHRSRG